MLLGCIADDSTGATDRANNLVRAGRRTPQTIGVPAAPLDADVDAVVVALKSRTIPAAGAVAQASGATALKQGPQIDPGVPRTAAQGAHPILQAPTSGNFGSRDFFAKSLRRLESTAEVR